MNVNQAGDHGRLVPLSKKDRGEAGGIPAGKGLLGPGLYRAMATAVMGTWVLAGALPALSLWVPRARELLRGLDPRVDYLLSTGFVLSCYAAALPFGWRAAGLYARHGDRAELWSSWFPAGTGFLGGLAYFFAGAPAGSIWGAWLWSWCRLPVSPWSRSRKVGLDRGCPVQSGVVLGKVEYGGEWRPGEAGGLPYWGLLCYNRARHW